MSEYNYISYILYQNIRDKERSPYSVSSKVNTLQNFLKTSCKVQQHHNQDVDIDIIKIENVPITKGTPILST